MKEIIQELNEISAHGLSTIFFLLVAVFLFSQMEWYKFKLRIAKRRSKLSEKIVDSLSREDYYIHSNTENRYNKIKEGKFREANGVWTPCIIYVNQEEMFVRRTPDFKKNFKEESKSGS